MLEGAKIGSEYGWNRLLRHPIHGTQTEMRWNSALYLLIFNHLKHVFGRFLCWTQTFASAVANVCNPGCKYLRPGRQPFICIGKCLLQLLFWCAMRHMTESSEGQFWAQKSVGRPLGEDSKGEKRPRMDGFLAQNGPNVQWFSLDGDGIAVREKCRFVNIYSHLMTFWNASRDCLLPPGSYFPCEPIHIEPPAPNAFPPHGHQFLRPFKHLFTAYPKPCSGKSC